MTLVAVHAVIDVPAHALMLLICVALRVAIRALKHRIVTWVGVARCADTGSTAVIDVEPRVVEHRARPSRHDLMARLARSGKTRRDVIRIIRTLIFDPVARITVGGNRSVVVVDVAASAHDLDVRPNQRETRIVMVKRCRLPRRRAMAHVAIPRESAGHVIRIGRALIVLQVATNTGRIS